MTTTSNIRKSLPLLLGLVLFAALFFQTSRGLLHREELPAFSVNPVGKIWLELGPGFPVAGCQQFADGLTIQGVIELTLPGVKLSEPVQPLGLTVLQAGESLDVAVSAGEIVAIQRGWMSAGQRVTLGVALHPDRMSPQDWQVLPGIGPKLAAAIELDRQKNGEFGRLERLCRVRGIGPRRIDRWREFF